MAAEPSQPSEREQRLGEIVFTCLQAIERGEPPDRQAVLARHPEFATELAEFFADRDQLEDLAAPLRMAVGAGGRGEATAEALPAGGRLGDFQIMRELGRGGMGVVYEAEQVSLGRRVALKVLPAAATLDPRRLQRFQNEARAAACLHHPHIVPVHAVGQEHGMHFYAMHLIHGQSLADVLRDLRRPAAGKETAPEEVPAADGDGEATTACPPPGAAAAEATAPQGALSTEGGVSSREYIQAVARLGAQAAEALDYAHQLGVVHRDIKPGNLMVDGRGELWITDFGVAQLGQGGDGNLTLTGDLVGTLRYMSPEQALGKRSPIDHRTDVYSLGATLYELLTLRPVFGGSDRQELLRQIAWDEPTPLRRLNKAMPAELETVVLKALEKNAADRYATAQELADDLGRFLKDEPIRARRPTLAQRASKWARRHQAAVLTTAVVSLVAAMGLAVATAVIWQAKDEEEAALAQAEGERQKAVEAAAREAEERRRADANFRDAADSLKDAQEAVDDLLTQLASIGLSDEPYLERLRRHALTEALRHYQKFLQRRSASPELRLAAARTYINAGDLQRELRELRQAEESIEAGLALVRALCVQDSTRPDYRDVLASGWMILGVLRLELKQVREAEEALRTARQIATALVAEHADNVSYRARLAQTWINLGAVYERDGRRQQAEECAREALRQCKELTRAAPHDPKYQQRLAIAWANLGALRAGAGDHAEAAKLFGEAVQAQEQVWAHSHAPRYRSMLAGFYQSLGDQQMHLGPFAEAHNTFTKALDHWYELNSQYPTVTDYAQAYAKALWFVGHSAMVHGQDRAAAELLSKADDLYTKLTHAYPRRKDYLHDLAACASQRGWLLAASYNAQVRDPAAAIEPAKKAVELEPDNGAYRATLGMAYYRAEYWQLALAALEEAGKRPQPEGRIDLFFLAMTHWNLGHKEDARKWYDQAEAWRLKGAPKLAPLAVIGREAAQLLEMREQQQEPRR
jgi:serine/threonine protein kinase